MTKIYISPSQVKALREIYSWSQETLGEKAKVDKRTISDIERNPEDKQLVQQKTFIGLRDAFDVSDEVLSGDEKIPSKVSALEITIKFDPRAKLNFDLIESRYGASFNDILYLAPMLFEEFAKEALSHQRKDFSDEQKLINNGSSDLVMERWGLKEYEELEDFMRRRKVDLNNNDVKCSEAYKCVHEALKYDRYEQGFEYTLLTHMDELLMKKANESGDVNLLSNKVELPINKFSKSTVLAHSVCDDELEKVTCGSKHARWALERGDVAISEIPEEYWLPKNAGLRVVWLEKKYNPRLKENSKLVSE